MNVKMMIENLHVIICTINWNGWRSHDYFQASNGILKVKWL